MSTIRSWLLIAAITTTAGCYKVTVNNLVDGGSPGREIVVPAHTILFGLVSLNDVDAAKVCGEKRVWSISTRYNGISWIASAFTAGLYIPMYARVTCED